MSIDTLPFFPLKCIHVPHLRPPLSKKVFPVGRVGIIYASREVGIFFFLISFFVYTRMYWGGGSKKNILFENMKKIFQSALFSPIGRWTGNYILLKGGPRTCRECGGDVTLNAAVNIGTSLMLDNIR